MALGVRTMTCYHQSWPTIADQDPDQLYVCNLRNRPTLIKWAETAVVRVVVEHAKAALNTHIVAALRDKK